EAWGDARAYDGTLSMVQPLVMPLYESIMPSDLYAVISGTQPNSAYALLRASWKKRISDDPEGAWTDALKRGVVPRTAFAPSIATPGRNAAIAADPPPGAESVDVIYVADPKVHDGSFANNAWLQELPAPITQLTWGNAALLSPSTARRVGVETGSAMSLS